MSPPATDWRPSATLETLKARADLLRAVREFFHARGVIEVDTPALSRRAAVDRHIESFAVPGAGWLHSSPEFGMKRLLAAGSGPIYQLSHVFRAEEAGAQHNPEFMLLEWYRPGWDHHRLMEEVEALVRGLAPRLPAFERKTYAEVFHQHAQLDPHADPVARLRERALATGRAPADGPADDRDFWLDFWMGVVIGEQLGRERPLFVHDFPASQAALARVRPGTPPLAERFELFWQGSELANGFHELGDAAEQQARFEADQAWRRAHGRSVPPFDAELIEALKSGLPPCAGVALGVDRLLMKLLGLRDIAQALPFGYGRR